jgi:hypothetical protein
MSDPALPLTIRSLTIRPLTIRPLTLPSPPPGARESYFSWSEGIVFTPPHLALDRG